MERIASQKISGNCHLTKSTNPPHEVTLLTQVSIFGIALATLEKGTLDDKTEVNMLSLKVHNAADYALALILLFVPALFGFSEIEVARNLFRVLGIFLLAYSLVTKYEFSAWQKLPLGAHMTFDLATGVILLLSPLVLGYRDLLSTGQELIHYILGFGLIGFVAVTRAKTEAEKKAFEPKETRLAS